VEPVWLHSSAPVPWASEELFVKNVSHIFIAVADVANVVFHDVDVVIVVVFVAVFVVVVTVIVVNVVVDVVVDVVFVVVAFLLLLYIDAILQQLLLMLNNKF